MSKHTQNDALCIADLSEYTISTGLYDYLYNEWYQRFSTDVTLKLSEHEQRKVAFYAGMKAAQQLLAPDGETHLCGGKYYTDKVLGEVCCRCQAPRR